MGDVYCACCKEPWDTHHLRFEAIHGTDLPTSFVEKLFSLSGPLLSFPGVRDAFSREGWKFAGNTLLAILRCPCCKTNEEQNEYDKEELDLRTTKMQVLFEMLGDDEDALQRELEDME